MGRRIASRLIFVSFCIPAPLPGRYFMNYTTPGSFATPGAIHFTPCRGINSTHTTIDFRYLREALWGSFYRDFMSKI